MGYIGFKTWATKSNPWPQYTSSSKDVNADIDEFGKENFSFTIIELCKGKAILVAREIEWQVTCHVLDGTWYNKCIGNIKYFNPGTYSAESRKKMKRRIKLKI